MPPGGWAVLRSAEGGPEQLSGLEEPWIAREAAGWSGIWDRAAAARRADEARLCLDYKQWVHCPPLSRWRQPRRARASAQAG